MTDATLMPGTGSPRPAVRLERHLPDPPPVVWSALTDREQLKAWFPCDVVVANDRWEVGAALTFPFPSDVMEDFSLTGEVLELEENRRLAYTWGDDVLRFELTPHDDGAGSGTTLVLIHELAPNTAARSAAGWDDCLDRLTGTKPTPGTWRTRFAVYASTFEPALGPQDGPPAGYKGTLDES